MIIKHTHSWFKTIIQDGVGSLFEGERGKYKREEFYDMYPEIKTAAYSYTLENANKKSATFTDLTLANFVSKEFEKLNEISVKPGELIRSVSSCNVDLIKWGARWDDKKIGLTLKVMKGIKLGKDNYFNNEDILFQFKRFFLLLKYKKGYENFDIEILVDNSRTHSTKLYDLNNINKNPSMNLSI